MPTKEPDITINGCRLSVAQASAVRVAITAFEAEVSTGPMRAALGDIADGYRDRLREVLSAIVMDGWRKSA